MKKSRFFMVLFICFALLVSVSAQAGRVDLKGKKITMSILGIAGWYPSKLGVDMSPAFAKYAKKKWGYDVKFTFEEAPFTSLFQKASASLATKSDDYNIIVSDSQWLGGFAAPGWIVKVNKLLESNPRLKAIKWYDQIVVDTYMSYPLGSKNYWGLPLEGDTMVLYVRKDKLLDPKERKAFKAKYGFDMPKTFEDFEKLTMPKFEKILAFFTRPKEGFYGLAQHTSKVYDFVCTAAHNYIWSRGGRIWDNKTGQVWGILNTDQNARSLAAYKKSLQWMPPGGVNYGNSQIMEAWNNGKVFCAIMWAAVGQYMMHPKGGEMMIVPPPMHLIDGKGKPNRVYSMGGQPWVINAFSDKEHLQVAEDFMEWWYTEDTQMEFARRGGNPVIKSVLDKKGFEKIKPWFRAYKFMLRRDRGRDFWHHPMYSVMLAKQQEAFHAYISGQVKDPKVALDYAAYHLQKILYEHGSTKKAPPKEGAKIRLK
ncbi:MAG: extracellular solute-binding protein [Deltaproteobacteria bacterium]|nr:extracellular solute-binding protein [Deltaproteobacteria bacterium]